MGTRTRIVATLGPATDEPGVLERMLRAGVGVARINFSHGDPEDHRRRIESFRALSAECRLHTAILADLPGPKLRVLIDQPRTLTAGQSIVFSAHDEPGTLGLTEPEVLSEVSPGDRVLLDDGRLRLVARTSGPNRLEATVVDGGTLRPNKGINLPDSPLTLPPLTPRDRVALELAAQVQVDWVALSFVRNAEAAGTVRAAMANVGLEAPVIAKIERPEGVAKAERIIDAFDGIMVARGDLGVEIPLESVPHVQKELVHRARVVGKPVVVATDMLDSMRFQPHPTRAEVSDVANAILDGADAIMLSGETAVGGYPVEAVRCMDTIAREAEAQWRTRPTELLVPREELRDHLSHTVCGLARRIGAEVIVVPTITGTTARLIARHRPSAAVVAPAPSSRTLSRMALVWGVRSVPMATTLARGADRIEAAVRAGFEHRVVAAGQLILGVAGYPFADGPFLPTIRVLRVGPQGQLIAP